jgi:[citrate (pro-3S)-lyase] ligase
MNNEKACIVMNANPFTLGHRFLIEEAAKENAEVLVLIVSEDQSDFPFEVRLKLVREGVVDLKNVTVIETGPYLVSQATFPTYFMKDLNQVSSIQTKLDCDIFLKYYKEAYHITKRYVGTEPSCQVTNTYNEKMFSLLPLGGVEMVLIDRLLKEEITISASQVRTLLKTKSFDQIKSIVPKSTYLYLVSEEAKPIIENLK